MKLKYYERENKLQERERESKLGWKGARKYLWGRRKLLEEGGGGVMQVREQRVFSSYKRRKRRRSKEYCARGVGATSLCVYLRHYALCSTCALHPVPMLTKSGCVTAAVATHCQLPVELCSGNSIF